MRESERLHYGLMLLQSEETSDFEVARFDGLEVVQFRGCSTAYSEIVETLRSFDIDAILSKFDM